MNSFILEAALVTRERCSHGAVRRPTHFGRGLPRISSLLLTIGLLGFATSGNSNASPEADAKAVAALDTKYQAAVKANDAATMDQILGKGNRNDPEVPGLMVCPPAWVENERYIGYRAGFMKIGGNWRWIWYVTGDY